jgi:hypothetical protein
MDTMSVDGGTRQRRTSGVRLVLVLVAAEAVAYFCLFLTLAGRLGQGAATAVVTSDVEVLGLTVFRGVRDGAVTTVQSAAWLLPALLLAPLLAWGCVAVLQRRSR